jgi:dienelactone hydrolase
MGMTVLGMDLHDASRALDYLCQQPFVDPRRIGVMGLSFGGTMATWMALLDDRIKAADVICYSDRFADFGMRDVNFCGSQITPGLYDLCDVPDLQGLIAPKPLLVEIGAYDACFKVESAVSCYREVERIYQAAGARERLELDLFEGGHRWGGNKSLEFFRKYL